MMKRWSDKYLGLAAILLGIALLAMHVGFKKALDEDEIQNLTRRFRGRNQYINAYAPDFVIERLDGTRWKLSEQLGTNIVVLNFFTTWCGPCRSEMEELDYFVDVHKGRPMAFLAIDVGERPEEVAAFLDEEQIALPVAVDEERSIADRYRINSYPTTIVILPEGRIVHYESGAIANADVSLAPIVNPYLTMIEKGSTFSLDDYFENVEYALPPRETDDAEESTNEVSAAENDDNEEGSDDE